MMSHTIEMCDVKIQISLNELLEKWIRIRGMSQRDDNTALHVLCLSLSIFRFEEDKTSVILLFL